MPQSENYLYLMKQIFRFINFCFLFFVFVTTPYAQTTFPVNGTHDKNHNYYAFTNATIYIDYQTILDSATLIIRDGKVFKTGKKLEIPNGTVVYDLKGKYIYPSFIDLYTSYGLPEIKKPKEGEQSEESPSYSIPQVENPAKGPLNWNNSIHPETKAVSMFAVNAKSAEELRSLGFGTALTHYQDGIARGTSALVTLSDLKENEVVISPNAASHFSFNKGLSKQEYPSSLMGAVALLRQTYYDAQWYAGTSEKKEINNSLEALNSQKQLPQIFQADDYLSVPRADKVGDEFGIQYIIKTKGDDYRRVEQLKATNAPLIVPVNFPKPYDVEDPYDALLVSFEDMKHWELAPVNLSTLEKAGISFALTTADLESKKSFTENLRKAIKQGLPVAAALKALTYTPALLLKAQNAVGALREGMLANFIITSDTLFHPKGTISENWVQGKQFIIQNIRLAEIRGDYTLNAGSFNYRMEVKGEYEKPKATLFSDTNKINTTITREGILITLNVELKDKNIKGILRLSGKINGDGNNWNGEGQLPDGSWIKWSAVRKSAFKEKPDTTVKDSLLAMGDILYPNSGYGFKELPKKETFLIKNTTVWTNEKEGVLKEADILIQNGKIAQVGQGITTPVGAVVIDGTGKHISSGIIDEHSHIAISKGVNESGQSVSAEVRIGDVINPDDVNIYRQLAGGVTGAQLLHGSANPIGGQSALIKLRWGRSAEELKMEGADGFIKCALGENVKQSNWGDAMRYRFPQTRMGVEQVFYDAFIRAREYDANWKKYNSLKPSDKEKPPTPRRDIELDALVEILNKKRFITCHSYVQSEINMLMHFADSMGFKINTFTHILEGYKVADKMKKHGVGASTFSDWWAYKLEVNDAIPYNGAILHERGIITAFNSDDAEMGRRLNQEAAKAVKYGGVREEEALKFVTLNPAKLLHLDNRTGSIKAGKDADMVLWSDNPLSIYARAEKTFVDGILYFDSGRDAQLRENIRTERARLTEKMLRAKKSGEETQKPEKKDDKPHHCDTVEK